MATPAQIAEWKAQPLPYCVTSYDKNAQRSRPLRRRFATVAEASSYIDRSRRPEGDLLIDYAAAFA